VATRGTGSSLLRRHQGIFAVLLATRATYFKTLRFSPVEFSTAVDGPTTVDN